MSKQEQAFWAVWEKIEPNHEKYNHRQMFDLGYEAVMKTLEETADYLCGCDHDRRCEVHALVASVKGEL